MWLDRVLNPGPLTYKSGALPTALRGPALIGKSSSILTRIDTKDQSLKGHFHG